VVQVFPQPSFIILFITAFSSLASSQQIAIANLEISARDIHVPHYGAIRLGKFRRQEENVSVGIVIVKQIELG